MIPKKPVPDSIRDGYRFPEKIIQNLLSSARRAALALLPERHCGGEIPFARCAARRASFS